MTERTLYESKQDLIAAADAVSSMRSTHIIQPAEIEGNDLPLMAIYPGSELLDPVGHDPREAEYTGFYDFEVVIAMKSDCTEPEVIALRNTFMQKLVAQQIANDYRPFVLTRLRHFIGDWAEFECWFIEFTFTRVTCEDFSS